MFKTVINGMVKFSKLAALLVALSLAACSQSKEGELMVNEEVTLAAPVNEVWGVVGDYYGLHNWHPAVNSTQASGEKDVRILILEGSGARVYEKQTRYKMGRSYSYDMVDVGPLPVQNYSSTVTVEPDGDGSKVIWVGNFDAAEGEKPEGVVKAITGVYRAGLDNLAKMFGR